MQEKEMAQLEPDMKESETPIFRAEKLVVGMVQ
jgi:hypothetical protein